MGPAFICVCFCLCLLLVVALLFRASILLIHFLWQSGILFGCILSNTAFLSSFDTLRLTSIKEGDINTKNAKKRATNIVHTDTINSKTGEYFFCITNLLQMPFVRYRCEHLTWWVDAASVSFFFSAVATGIDIYSSDKRDQFQPCYVQWLFHSAFKKISKTTTTTTTVL